VDLPLSGSECENWTRQRHTLGRLSWCNGLASAMPLHQLEAATVVSRARRERAYRPSVAVKRQVTWGEVVAYLDQYLNGRILESVNFII
jgi:hypothetical protein